MERKLSDWGGSIVIFIAVLAVNFLSNALPLNGQTPKDVSDKYPSLFTPESFTFGIWGVIYTGLALFVIYQALPAQRNNPTVARTNKLFMLNGLANIAWIFAWHYGYLLTSLAIMCFILLTLVVIYEVLGIANGEATFVEHLFLYIPFSLYSAWISVALIANLSIVQVAMGLENTGLSEVDWTLLKLAIPAVVCAVVVLRKGDVIFGLVIAWAAYGIMSKQSATPEVSTAAGMLAAVAVILVAYEAIRQLLGNSSAPR